VRAQRLLAALLRARTLTPSEHLDAIDALAKATNTRRRHLSVHERGRVILVALEQVIYLKAELKYITVRTRERESLIEESLTSLEEEFSDRFVRIHRKETDAPVARQRELQNAVMEEGQRRFTVGEQCHWGHTGACPHCLDL